MSAAAHIAEMKDLAERIVGMGNTLATYDSERPETNVTVWNLGRELAELVVHFNLDDALNHLSTARTALDDPYGLEPAVVDFYTREVLYGQKILDDEALKGAAVAEIDQAIHELREEER